MLVLSRKEDQSIVFPNLGISIEIVRVQGNKVSVGVEAPKAIRIVRGELQAATLAPKSKDCSSDIQLGQFFEILAPETRTELRDQLNAAGVAVQAAQKQCELGGLENAEFFLSKALEALGQLNKMFELPQAAAPSDCVKESQSMYGRASQVPGISANDRRVSDWFSQLGIPHKVIEYLQHQLCSSN